MYKIDDEFRPGGGRVFVKATHEHHVTPPNSSLSLTTTKSNYNVSDATSDNAGISRRSFTTRGGSAITTNIEDQRNMHFQHEIKHERTIEAVVRDSVPITRTMYTPEITSVTTSTDIGGSQSQASFHTVTRNKRLSTEVLGSSMESTKLSQRAPNGHRRITTHIVRKVTTMSRAEEQQQLSDDNMHSTSKMVLTTEISGGMPPIKPPTKMAAIESKRMKVM